MLRSRLLRLVAPLAFLPCLTTAARGESPASPCYRPAEIRPGMGGFPGSLPANAPALVFIPSAGWGAHILSDYQLELRDQDQTVVPATFESEGGNYLIRPSRPLVGAQLSVSYRDFCSSSYSASNLIGTTVNLSAASALPTTIGTPTLRESFVRYSQGGVVHCLPASVYSVVDVRMSPELQAYRAVSRWDITYKGQARRVEYGDLQTGGEVAYVMLEDTCGPDTESVGGPVTIAVHVAGATSDPPPLQLTISARCPDFQSQKAPPACTSINPVPPEPGPLPDGGGVIIDSAAPDTNLTTDGAPAVVSGNDAGASDTPPAIDSATPRAGSGAGCRMGTSGKGSESTLWTALLLVLLALGRAARRRTRAR